MSSFNKSLIIAFLVGVSIFISALSADPVRAQNSVTEPMVTLTPEEKAWLDAHPVIRVHNETDWPPFNYFTNGRPQGFSIDFMNLVAKKTGLKIKYITGPTWDEFLSMMKSGDLDVMLNIVRTPEREKYLLYTQPFVANPNSILSRKEETFDKLEDLFGKTVSVPKGFFQEEIIRRDYPQIKLLPVKDVLESMKAVSYKKADAAVGELAVFNYLIGEHFMTDLTVSGELKFGDSNLIHLNMATRLGMEPLVSILNKGIGAITLEEMNQIRRKWLARLTDEEIPIPLTDAERKWLAEHRDLRLGVDPAWPPFEFIDKNGQYAGVGSGFIDAISDRLKIKMTHIPDLTWSQVIEKVKTGEIDVLPAVTQTSERDKYLNFTKPYLSFPVVIANNKKIPFIGSIKGLEGYQVGVVKDYYTEDILRNDHSYLTLVTYPTLEEALQELDAGRIDAFVDNMITISQEIARSGLENIRVSSSTEYTFELSLGVRKDLPELIGILNKVIDDISSQEKAAIQSTWMSDVEVKIRFDFKAILAWAIPIGGSVFLIIAFVVVWNRKLGREIKERKLFEEALRASDEKSRLLLESVDEGIFGVDAQGRCTFANPTAMKLLGYSNEELIGQNIHTAIHHSHEDGTPYPMENCPMFKSFTEGTAHRIADEVLWRKDGTHFPVEYASTPMEKDDSLVGAVITFGDITERKAAEERFSALLESAPDAMIVSDETGTIVLVNSQAEVLFGYSREELIGKKIDMLVPEDIREVHPGYRAKFYADPKRLSMGFRSDFYGIAKDGRKIPMDIGLSPIETAEGLLVVASARDIRERIEAEAALRESEKRLQSILDTSPVGVAFSTKGKIQFANPRFKEMFGVGAGDSSPDLYVHPKERDVLVTKLTTEGKVEGYEIQLYNRDHEVREFLITYLPITFDDEEGILGWLLDITDRKNAEKEIKEKFDELTRFRRLAVGREKMMIELKKEINELAAKLGLDQMYKIVP